MNHSEFVHKNFRADEWESEVKAFIDNLPVPPNSLWYKGTSELKRAREELVTLGYYVKYK